jgi:hypothetical protein
MTDPLTTPATLPEATARRFLERFAAHLDENGVTAIQALHDTKLYDYLRIAIALLPKELRSTATLLEDMSDEDLAKSLEAVQALLDAQRQTPTT